MESEKLETIRITTQDISNWTEIDLCKCLEDSKAANIANLTFSHFISVGCVSVKRRSCCSCWRPSVARFYPELTHRTQQWKGKITFLYMRSTNAVFSPKKRVKETTGRLFNIVQKFLVITLSLMINSRIWMNHSNVVVILRAKPTESSRDVEIAEDSVAQQTEQNQSSFPIVICLGILLCNFC